MPDADTAWLVEVEDAIGKIKTFTRGYDEARFLADERTCAATAMYLLVIGEAARRLSFATQNEAPEIPWPVVVSLRNRIAHGYKSIDHQTVWAIVAHHLPPLETAVRRMLTSRGE
ncbi:MAG: DUF86 domain-containing protein [Hyphomonadaceae bacterium]|nr:DUF86 domain-containing protein [Hyphomonadaceae bacterium]